jgi:hypothetical protein
MSWTESEVRFMRLARPETRRTASRSPRRRKKRLLPVAKAAAPTMATPNVNRSPAQVARWRTRRSMNSWIRSHQLERARATSSI